MKKKGILLVAALATSLGGCATDLRTGEINVRKQIDPLQAGFVYNLPAAVVTPKASIRVAGCPADEEAKKALAAVAGQSALPVPIKGAVFAVTGDIAVEQMAGKQILLDYRELGDFLKTSSIGLERHPNLMLKSINVAVEDESPALIANLAVVVADIALFTVSPPAAAGAAGVVAQAMKDTKAKPQSIGAPATPDPVSYVACKPDTVKLLETRKTARDAKDKDTQNLEEANAALAKLLRHADSGFTPAELAAIHSYRDKIVDLTASIAEATDTIAGADAKLSLKLDIADGARAASDIKANGLPIDNIVGGSVTLSVDAARIQIFIDRHFVSAAGRVQPGVGAAFNVRECTKEIAPTCETLTQVRTAVLGLSSAKLEAKAIQLPVDGYTPSFANPPEGQLQRTGTVHASSGIIYVEPARYSFSITQATYPPDPLLPVTTLKTVTASVPQLGTYLSLPVHAGFGEKVELKATFSTDGSLVTGSYGRPSSAGKALSTSLAGLADKALATRDAIAARKLALLKAQADRLTAQKAILDAQDKLNPKDDPLADINAQIAVANANATLAEANVRLIVANAKLNAGQ